MRRRAGQCVEDDALGAFRTYRRTSDGHIAIASELAIPERVSAAPNVCGSFAGGASPKSVATDVRCALTFATEP
jgi:hypothetical protein